MPKRKSTDSKEIAALADTELMSEAGMGSHAAFAELVRRHQNPLVNFFVRMGASDESEDLAQETFLRLYRYRERYRPNANFTALLYHIARNAWADRGRKIIRRERLWAELHKSQPSGGVIFDGGLAGEALDIESALATLSPKLREVLVLKVFQGMQYQEIAESLRIPEGTVKSRLHLALAALKKLFHEND